MRQPSGHSRRPAGSAPYRRARLGWVLGLAAFSVLVVLGLALLNPSRTLTGEDWAQVAYCIGFIVLVASSLAARRLRLGQAVRHALLWLSLFALLLVAYGLRDELWLMIGR